jgi:hypothetical protein
MRDALHTVADLVASISSIPRPATSIGRPLRWLSPAAVAAACLAGCTGRLLPFASNDDTSSASEISDRQQRQLQLFEATLRNVSPDIETRVRRQAAEELMAMDLPAATTLLVDALRSGDPPAVEAVIEAMETSPRPVPGLLEPAVSTLQDSSGEDRDKLALILPRYGRPALDLVAQRALDAQEPPERRIGPIHALAAFRSRESAYQLMVLLEEETTARPGIQRAACESLQMLTGLPYGSDAAQWRLWWNDLKDRPIEDWLRIVVQQLSERNTKVEQEIRQQERVNEAIASRLADTYRELFLGLPIEEQNRRLLALLDDELPQVRQFAVGRVERMLRDSARVPDPVLARLAERLSDAEEYPELRLWCARLLNDLNYPATPALIGAALAASQDETIACGYLEIVAKRPSGAALPSILPWLGTPGAGQAAAAAVWAEISVAAPGATAPPDLRAAALRAFEIHKTPAHARLVAALGKPAERGAVTGLLDSGSPDMKRAVSQGLAWAGDREPLLARASDTEVYPFAVAVLTRGRADLATLGTLAELTPPPQHRQAWSGAVLQVAGGLAPADLLAADDLLASKGVRPAVRAGVLARTADLAPDAIASERRGELLARLTELLIASGEYQRAFEVSQRLTGSPPTAALAQLKFRAAVLAAHYDDAVAISGTPRVWVDAFARVVEEHPQPARALGAEIDRRFHLDEQTRSIFETAKGRLTPEALSNGTPVREAPR